MYLQLSYGGGSGSHINRDPVPPLCHELRFLVLGLAVEMAFLAIRAAVLVQHLQRKNIQSTSYPVS